MTKAYGFTKDNAQRVLRATETVERQIKNLPHGTPRAKVGTVGFYAKLTGKSGHKYSWEAVKVDDSDDLVAATDQWTGTTDENYAISYDKTEYALVDDIVWLTGARSKDCFLFKYAPGVMTGKSSGSISQRSGSVAGTGNVRIETFDDPSLTAGETIKVFNNFKTLIPTSKDLQITYGQGVWWVSAVDCK